VKKTTPMQIAEDIASRIGKGLLHPGEHLVETVLANEYNTSRAPVREALLMLERDRLVQRIPHHGFVVKRFTRKQIHELYDVLYRLEEIAIIKAIRSRTDEDLETLEQLLANQRAAVEAKDVPAYYELNEEFHNLIFSIAGNETLSDLYLSLHRPAKPFRLLSLAQSDNLNRSFSEHAMQVEAIRSRDEEAALSAIREQEIRALRSLDLLFPE